MSSSEKPLAIDIPVQLPELKVAFSVAALAFEGDLPASIFHLELIAKDAADWRNSKKVPGLRFVRFEGTRTFFRGYSCDFVDRTCIPSQCR